MAILMLCGCCLTAFADGDDTVEVEEIVDAVAEKEAAEAAAAEKAEMEAAKVNDVVDLDAESADIQGEEALPEIISSQEVYNASIVSGPILALIAAFVLIVFGLMIIAASNKKIKAGKRVKSGA